MSNTIGWGKAAENNTIGYGDGKDNSTNGWGSAYENSWSGETLLEVLLTAPVNVSAPVVSGTASVGSVLTTTNGTWDNEPTSYTYQWKRNGSNILSATANTYTIVAEDVSQSITCTVTAINDAGSASATSNTITPTWETDAQAFITAAAITDPTQQSAVNQLVIDLKGYGVWTKMKALYPFVGGTASQHKFNLKDPRDLDAAFRLVFNGGWAHSANGALPNGVNGYADTKLNAFTLPLNQNSTSFSAYSRTQTAPSNQMIIGTVFGGFTGMSFIQCNVTGGAGATGIGVYSTSTGVVNNNTTGLFVASRNASNNFIAQIRGNQTTLNFSSAQPYNQSFFIGGSTFNSVYDNKQVAFAHIGDGLNSTELTNLNTAVQTFQTALNRQIP